MNTCQPVVVHPSHPDLSELVKPFFEAVRSGLLGDLLAILGNRKAWVLLFKTGNWFFDVAHPDQGTYTFISYVCIGTLENVRYKLRLIGSIYRRVPG